jgi:hypothetical protein
MPLLQKDYPPASRGSLQGVRVTDLSRLVAGKPQPFVWTAKARDILQKVIRANARLSSKQNEALH